MGAVKIGVFVPELYKGVFYDVLGIRGIANQLRCKIAERAIMQPEKSLESLRRSFPECIDDVRIKIGMRHV
jgi:hypothetical protein